MTTETILEVREYLASVTLQQRGYPTRQAIQMHGRITQAIDAGQVKTVGDVKNALELELLSR